MGNQPSHNNSNSAEIIQMRKNAQGAAKIIVENRSAFEQAIELNDTCGASLQNLMKSLETIDAQAQAGQWEEVQKGWENIRAQMGEVRTCIDETEKKAAEAGEQAAKAVANPDLGQTASEHLRKATGFLGGLWSKAKSAAEGVVEQNKETLDALKNKAEGLTEGLKAQAGEAVAQARGAAEGLKTQAAGLKAQAEEAATGLKAALPAAPPVADAAAAAAAAPPPAAEQSGVVGFNPESVFDHYLARGEDELDDFMQNRTTAESADPYNISII